MKELPVSPIHQIIKFGIPLMERSTFRNVTLRILVCCLCAVHAASTPVSAQETSQSSAFAGPIEPTDWKFSEWKSNRVRLRYTQALQVERLGNADREALTRGVEYYLYSMTAAEPPVPLIELRRRLLTELRSTITKNSARQYMLSEIVRISENLLDQPPGPRLTVMVLLASLSSNPTPEDPLPYEPANSIQLTVLNDPNQLVQCKIWAANGLGRISRDGNPTVTIKSDIAVSLVNALDSPEAQADVQAPDSAEYWYRMRLVDALGDNGLPANINADPVAIDALIEIIADPDEHWAIRATAARAITQLRWSGDTNVSLITYFICRLTHDMGQTYNQQLAQNDNQEAPFWRGCFFNCYRAFQPRTADEKARGWGLLQQAGAQDRAKVQAAYQVVLPVINSVTRDRAPQQIPQAAIDNLDGWLNGNVPTDFKVTPASDELKILGSVEDPPPASSLNPGSTEGSDTQVVGTTGT